MPEEREKPYNLIVAEDGSIDFDSSRVDQAKIYQAQAELQRLLAKRKAVEAQEAVFTSNDTAALVSNLCLYVDGAFGIKSEGETPIEQLLSIIPQLIQAIDLVGQHEKAEEYTQKFRNLLEWTLALSKQPQNTINTTEESSSPGGSNQ